MERFQTIVLAAGLGCFILAFLLSGLYPYMITDHRQVEATIEDLAEDVSEEFKGLKDSWPVAFAQSFPRADECLTARELIGLPEDDPRRAKSAEAWRVAYAAAIDRGRDVYVADACWHCHSQYVRPVANESMRYGPVSVAEQDNNALQRPMLWGTRRVGPDLTYEGGKRSNDWHVAHFWNPESTSPGSVMARYDFYFRSGYQVVRGIDPKKASFGGLDEGTTYPYPGIFDTEAEAQEELERIKSGLDSDLADEAERLEVVEAVGPDEEVMALVAYLQWLGTWEWQERAENDDD